MRISIIGCGWLGLPLGEHLAQQGHQVAGSTTSEDKLEVLEKAGITPFLFRLEPMPAGKLFNDLFDTDLLFVNIPPGRRKNPPEYYEEQIKYLTYLINQHKIPRVIFISSTSYYPSNNGIVDVNTPYDFDSGSGKAVVQAEKQIIKVESELLILRCGGLMGGTRIPGRWFAGKPTKGADTPVNYIHRADIIQLVTGLVKKQTWIEPVMNVVNPLHPTRREVHETMAIKYGFDKPIWVEPKLNQHKVVKSSLNVTQLKYKSPLDY
jgi:nucleoside-diphosphate-sugar epimerase